jgi:hypothetical protein
MKPADWDDNVRIPLRHMDCEAWRKICDRPTVWEERWRVIPFGGLWAIRYEPVGKINPHRWKHLWCVVEVWPTKEAATQRIMEAF